MADRSEAQFQQRCVLWWKNTYLEKAKRLFAVVNEGRDVTVKLGVGMTPGVCDLLYVDDEGYLWGRELKLPGTSHKVSHLKKQAKWMIEVLGDRGRFVDSFEDFQTLMLGGEAGIKPQAVLEYLEGVKTNSIIWDGSRFSITEKAQE